jgi:hypothetical protein
MGKKFDQCVKSGGRVFTVKPTKTTYLHICKKNGKSYSGVVKHDKPKKK